MASRSDPSDFGNPNPFANPLDEVLNERARRIANNYYRSRFRYEWFQKILRQQCGESLSELERDILNTPYPTLAQHMAYDDRLHKNHQTEHKESDH